MTEQEKIHGVVIAFIPDDGGKVPMLTSTNARVDWNGINGDPTIYLPVVDGSNWSQRLRVAADILDGKEVDFHD